MIQALAKYDAALEAANAEYAAAIAPVGGYLGSSQAEFMAVILPANAAWDAKVGAAYAAYQEAVS